MKDFVKFCEEKIIEHYKNKLKIEITSEDVFPVWQCKTLEHKKAIFSVFKEKRRFIEITLDGNKEVAYMDIYSKVDNRQYKYNE